GKYHPQGGRGRFDTPWKESCIRGSHGWSKIRIRGRFLDAGAIERNGTDPAAICGSGERGGDGEIDASGFRVDPEGLMKMNWEEQSRKLLRQYGRHLLVIFVVVLLVHDVFGTHGFLAMRHKQQEIQKVNTELDRLNKENGALQQEIIDLHTDPQTIRKIAREELGLAQPGE